MFNILLGTKLLNCFANIPRSIVCSFINLGILIYEKYFKQWVMTCLVAATVCAEKPDYVLIVICTYLNLPNPAIWVTCICHKWLGGKLWVFTPRCGTGKYCGHTSHCLTIWWVNPNFFLRLLLFWWCKACNHWTCSTWDKAINFVSLSAKVLPSTNEPGRFECTLIWPTKHDNFLRWMASWNCWNRIFAWLLLVSIAWNSF